MKLKSTTLQLLAGVAALSTAIAADKQKADPPAAVPAPAPGHDAQAFRKIQIELLFAIVDKDRDEVITRKEFRKAYAEMEKRILAANPKRPKPQPGFDPCVACGLG